jgi:pyruvate,water dikinase
VKLDRLRRLVWLREQMRDLSNRMYYHVRRHVLLIADEREIGDDIFFMTFPEIVTDQRSQVDHRRETYEGFRNFDAPGEIGARYPLRNEAASAVAIGAGLNEAGRNALVGIAASRGVARGVARVARTAHDAARIERGAILVCPFTDPGWTPVLDRVAGVVTEVGGLLSHAAVICREYGIPAVLGVPAATMRIVDGMEVTLDANAGCVHWMNTP